ncbi:MAG TPA: hypothetical protein VMT88_03330 [Actinomycetes bacterium]|nr:hypothetical protein [Actinomycetes bacterium]
MTLALAGAMTFAMATPASALIEREPLVRDDGHALSGCHLQLTQFGKISRHEIGYRGLVRCDQNWDRLHVHFEVFNTDPWKEVDYTARGFGGDGKGKHHIHSHIICGEGDLDAETFELHLAATAHNLGHRHYSARITRSLTVRC